MDGGIGAKGEKRGRVMAESGSEGAGGKGYSNRGETSKGVPRNKGGECRERFARQMCGVRPSSARCLSPRETTVVEALKMAELIGMNVSEKVKENNIPQ